MFENIVGQHAVKAHLQSLIEGQRMPHALLFCGTQGVGKFATAVALAQALLGTDKLLHPDLHYVYPVYKPKGWASERKAVSDDYTADWRSMMQDTLYFDREEWCDRIKLEGQKFQIGVGESDEIVRKLSLVSAQGGWKVMIIWLPELMSQEAANKLLKILEEPPQQTLFILVSEQSELLLETIRSRTQRIDFSPLREEEVAEELIQHHGLTEDDAHRVAHGCSGSLTRALSAIRTDNDDLRHFGMFVLLMRHAYGRQVTGMWQWTETMAGKDTSRAEQRNFLLYCQRFIRECFVYNFQNKTLNYMTQDEADFASRFARFINERNIIPMYELFDTALRDIRQNTNSRMVFFDLALQITMLLRA